jgi:hypothetical protein
MPVPIWYTIDLFFRDWDKNNAASALWLTVQPHVERKYLAQWLPTCGKLSESDNKIWISDNTSAIDPETLVPVPIPGDAKVSITLSRGGSTLFSTATAIPPLPPINRQVGPYLTDPIEFAGHNRPAQPTDAPDGSDPQRPVPTPLTPGVYAQLYAAQLADAYQQSYGVDPNTAGATMAAMLQLAFHGGTTRHVSSDWFSSFYPEQMLMLDSATENAASNVKITNIHSLLGMQFLLAHRPAPNLALAGKVSLKIELTSADGSAWSDDFANYIHAGEFEQWFDWFALDQDVSTNYPLTASVIPGFNQRIYVHDAPEAFSRLGSQKIWRRRTQEEMRNGRFLSDAKRFIIRPVKQTDPPPTKMLNAQPYAAVDCELRPYRSSGKADGSSGPLQLRPKPQSRDRFAACFSAPSQPSGIIILDQNANPVQLDWLGAYALPWDSGDALASVRTVLFWGTPTGQDVTVLIPASSAVLNCAWVENSDAGYDADQLGRRWETTKFDVATNGFPFDAFLLTDEVGDAAAGVIFPDSLNFVPARSVEAVEGALKATYPSPDIVNSSTFDPPSFYAHDLVNYNALNVRDAATTPCGGQLLNPDSSDYAVWHSPPDNSGFVDQTFHYRFAVPSDPDVNSKSLDPGTVGKFFNDQFSAAGTPRGLDFELVHTFGPGICLEKAREMAARPHARLPMLPNEVSSQLAKDPTTAKTAFLWISYVEGVNPNPDKITLSFDESCLSIPNLGSSPSANQLGSARMRMISAFRSLAEIGYAGKATLVVRGCNFDYTKLVGMGAQFPLAQGLFDNIDASQWTHDLSDLASKCRQRLTNMTTALPSYPITLTAAETARFRNCNLIEFSIRLDRTAGASPPSIEVPPPSKADLLRIRTDLGSGPSGTNVGYDDKGQRTDPAEAAANRFYPSWQKAMSGRTRPVLPDGSNSQAVRDVFAAGGDLVADDAAAPNAAAAWIAPPGAPAVAGDWPQLYFFPLGFLPLKRSPDLGTATTTIMRRFFDALAFVIDARPGAWNNPWLKQQWSDHFKKLESRSKDLLKLTNNALFELVRPAHRDRDVDAPVAGQITNFNSATEQARWTAAVGQLAITAPGVFGSAKGLQVMTIGSGSGQPIRSDLFQIIQQHNTTPGDDKSKLLRTTDIRQGLPASTDSHEFIGLDVLDDVAYGDRYQVGNFVENSFEKLIDQASGASNNSVKAYVPSSQGAPKDPIIALPSREPLTLPHHLFTGTVAGAGTPDWWKSDDHRYISSQSLVGKPPQITTVDASKQDGLLRVAGGPGAGPSLPASRLDRCIVNAIFSVNSDEKGSFANDIFWLRYNPVPIPAAVESQDNTPNDFFEKLLSSSLENNEELDQVADQSNVVIMANAVVAAPAASPPQDVCTIQLAKDGNLTISGPHTSDGWCISAALYQVPQTTKDVCRAYLIVTFNVPVWQITTLGLYQGRNVGGLDVPPFAPGFGQTSGPVGSDVTYIPYSSPQSFLEKSPQALPRQPMTAESLIQQLIVAGQYIDPSQWQGVLAEVTIHHRQTVSLMSDAGSGEGKGISVDTGKYALVRCEHVPGQTSTAVDFLSPYKDFLVDFIWHQSGNEFFRILDFPVTIS